MILKSKYELGNIVYYMEHNAIQRAQISEIRIAKSKDKESVSYKILFKGCSVVADEDKLFATKKALVDKLLSDA